MGRIKITEAKPGDLLSSTDFNSNMSEFRTLEIDGTNIAQEGINQSKVTKGTVFDEFQSVQLDGKLGTIIHASDNSVCNFNSDDVDDDSWIAQTTNKITMTDAFASGESIVCRASSRIYMRDFGSRTFYAGVPPLVSVQLMYTFDSTPSTSSTWYYATGTKQWFSCAFSSKIPSDSGGDSRMTAWVASTYSGSRTLLPRFQSSSISPSRPDLITLNAGESGEAEYDVQSNDDMFFHYDFSYTTGWVLNYSDVSAHAPITSITFALMGTAYDPSNLRGGMGSSWDYATSSGNAEKGCRKVKYRGFDLRNLDMYMYKVKK